jgi:hypothetical protein
MPPAWSWVRPCPRGGRWPGSPPPIQGDPNFTNNVSAGTTIVHRFGYWVFGSDGGVFASDGGVFAFGDAGSFGDLSGRKLGAAIVGMAGTPSGHGYWLVASNGGVFSFGDAPFLGSMAGPRLNKPMIGLTSNA